MGAVQSTVPSASHNGCIMVNWESLFLFQDQASNKVILKNQAGDLHG